MPKVGMAEVQIKNSLSADAERLWFEGAGSRGEPVDRSHPDLGVQTTIEQTDSNRALVRSDGLDVFFQDIGFDLW